MIKRYEILDPGSPRPGAERIVFCDGAGGRLFRPETDLELSHWRPNRTPARYRAGTSTEICYRFLDDPAPGPWTVAVNNHLDVDGILSVYVLVHSEHAREHRRNLIEAAEMGDFWGWGEAPAQRVFQGLTLLMNEARAADRDVQSIYAEAFRRVPGLIDGGDAQSGRIEETLLPLRRGVSLVDAGTISRTLIDERFAQYTLPARLVGDDASCATYVPGFNEVVSDAALLWPQVRARWDAQRLCLVSAELDGGWSHDLWAPGYLWADTEGLWTIPGLTYRDGMERYELDHAPLGRALKLLQERESGAGQWSAARGVSPFADAVQSLFPVIVRYFDPGGKPGRSHVSPEDVATILAGALTQDAGHSGTRG